MNIAVVGAGMAGMTASFLLSEQGHKVTLFEQASKCQPIGAGILLQPSGQRVLDKLGLLKQIEEFSPKLEGLLATCRSGQTLVSLRYDRLAQGFYGLGVRRSLLFSILFDRCQRSAVDIVEDARIESIEEVGNIVEITLKGKNYNFDLVVAADGSRSTLRKILSPQTKVHEYSYAALWTLAKSSNLTPRLWQMVDGTKRLIGVLPVEKNLCSFFWGIRQDEKELIWKNGIDKWKQVVLEFEPKLAEIVNSIESLDQLSFATYRRGNMKKYHHGRIVFIGDAAHASSPHLGQGVNLALEDATALVEAFSQSDDYREIFSNYELKRKASNNYYSVLTGMLTPFFQSDHALLGIGRNIALPIMSNLPFVGKQMVYSMSGLKKGWLDF